MKTAKEVLESVPYSTVTKEVIIQLMQEYGKEVLTEAINTIAKQPCVPVEGEEDYRPGKYMALGMLYEFKDKMIV